MSGCVSFALVEVQYTSTRISYVDLYGYQVSRLLSPTRHDSVKPFFRAQCSIRGELSILENGLVHNVSIRVSRKIVPLA